MVARGDKVLFVLLFVAVCLVLWAGIALSQPDNDADPRFLDSASGSTSGDSTGATFGCHEPSAGASVWFNWLAPSSGQYTFHTDGSAFDTLLAVYDEQNFNLFSTESAEDRACTTIVISVSPIVENDDVRSGTSWSMVTFQANQGERYMIQVDGFGGASGTYRLSWYNAREAARAAWLAGLATHVEFSYLPPGDVPMTYQVAGVTFFAHENSWGGAPHIVDWTDERSYAFQDSGVTIVLPLEAERVVIGGLCLSGPNDVEIETLDTWGNLIETQEVERDGSSSCSDVITLAGGHISAVRLTGGSSEASFEWLTAYWHEDVLPDAVR